MLKAAAGLSALVLLAGCATVNERVSKTLENNPFTKKKDEAPVVSTPAPTPPSTPTTTTTTTRTSTPSQTTSSTRTSTTRTSTPRVTAPAYSVPTGGPNTFSLSVSSCLSGCEIVNVMIDPDNYWQRTATGATTKGQSRARMYDDVANAFQAQGFYAFQGQLDILPGNDKTCSDYAPGGQVFFLSMSRNSGQRIVNYDTGCAGSASADAAADAINTLVQITDYMEVVSGNAATIP
jgi:hypothetical protein